jgi:hypothetical protein
MTGRITPPRLAHDPELRAGLAQRGNRLFETIMLEPERLDRYRIQSNRIAI